MACKRSLSFEASCAAFILNAFCNCTKPEVLLQSALALRDDLQNPEVELGVNTLMLKSAIIGATFKAEIKRA
ncbi:hypothetical protein SLE2022_026870 [Rubroshorea leprosula]